MTKADQIRELIWKLQQQGMTKSEVSRVVDTLRYSPPVRPNAPQPDKTEASVSPIITGIRGTTKQPVNMEGNTSGEGQALGDPIWSIGGSVTGA